MKQLPSLLNIRKLYEQNQNLFTYLRRHSGNNITTLNDVAEIYDILTVEKESNFTLPNWTVTVFPNKLKPLAAACLASKTELPFMKKVKGGPLVTDIINKMKQKRSNLLHPNRSIFVYSAHDITLVNVMNSLGILSQAAALPDYGAALVFELHHSVTYDDDFEVKIVYYFNGDDKFPKEITIPRCSHPCSLTQFLNIIKPIQIKFEDYDKICEL